MYLVLGLDSKICHLDIHVFVKCTFGQPKFSYSYETFVGDDKQNIEAKHTHTQYDKSKEGKEDIEA